MDKAHPVLAEKSGSFSGRDEKKHAHRPSRNLSVNYIRSHMHYFGSSSSSSSSNNEDEQDVVTTKDHPYKIVEEDPTRELEDQQEQHDHNVVDSDGVIDTDAKNEADVGGSGEHQDLAAIYEEIDIFLATTVSDQLVPFSTIQKFALLVEEEINRIEGGEERPSSLVFEGQGGGFSLLEAIDKLSKLTTTLAELPPEQRRDHAFNRAGTILQEAMAFLEDEFKLLLEDPRPEKVQACTWNQQPVLDDGTLAANNVDDGDVVPDVDDQKCLYPKVIVERLQRIAGTMISAGYERECYQVFSIHRRCSLEAALAEAGFEKKSIDDIQKMGWETLEGEIVKWNTAFRQYVSDSFSLERELCLAVFSSQPTVAVVVFTDLSCGLVAQLLNFAEAVAMTKRSAEKLFKLLDMYETLRDFSPKLEEGGDDHGRSSELVMELSEVRLRLGEAAVRIFTELENSIKSDTAKMTVPGGAVHPLTRYVMNYVKYVCEYKSTLTQLFEEHYQRSTSETCSPPTSGDDVNAKTSNSNNLDEYHESPFATEMMTVMDLLGESLEAKSKLYKDLSLSYIFLMNNGRYMMQKVKGSPEIKELLGDTWCRKRSSDLRQYHKSYQRETWGKVLDCLRDEGLQTNKRGSVSKPVLKERFKTFNSTFDEIHKTQSSWVVSDEQLQSELRVSVSAVVVPAYRSFLGRFSQYLDAGRQTEKYIKFGPEELENYIDELFDGNPSSMVKRRA